MPDLPLLALIDYGSGNLRSAAKAFERVAGGRVSILVTSDPADLARAGHIVLPGVGAFADCMRGLQAIPGMRDAMEREVREAKKPFLGICVGMQMLFTTGHEHGTHAGLGWIPGEIVRIAPGHAPVKPLKIPHMGWNDLQIHAPDPLLDGIRSGDHAYFVHSYHAVCRDPGAILATVDYGTKLTAVVASGNVMGTQFHPEKSQATGLKLLENFLGLE